MSLKQTLDRLSRLDYLIRHRATGTPEELAEKLGITRSTWFRWKEELTIDLGLPIGYDSLSKTYFYTKPTQVTLLIDTQPPEIQEVTPPIFHKSNLPFERPNEKKSLLPFMRLAIWKFGTENYKARGKSSLGIKI